MLGGGWCGTQKTAAPIFFVNSLTRDRKVISVSLLT